MPLKGFPKQIALRDGTRVTLRPMVKDDGPELLEFFRRLSPEDRQFLKDDVTRPEIIEAWVRDLNYDRVLPILAEAEGRIVGDATLHRQAYGWMRHVGEIRVVTDAYFRRRGLASAMAREIFYLALQVGLDKMVAEMGVDQVAAIKVFQKLGFQQEARLANHIVDIHGRKHDLLILSTDIPALMQTMQETFFRAAGSVDD
ncbi:MAG TPA: GNAT family protein [Candidatus Methylomirabilis sp.]|nr:GNAT family protein [Candidatus Methylomirabilis sp.]